MFIQHYWTWLRTKVTTKARDILLKVLASGPTPKHVAFIMDGNRRYARLNHMAIKDGHSEGFVALRQMLEVCIRLNIHCVSVYAFSIENFKRSEDEVQVLMNLAEEKLIELCKQGDILDEHGVRLNVIGRKELLPAAVQRAVLKAEGMTRTNTRFVLNFFMPYTARDEITTAVDTCISKVRNSSDKSISEFDVDSHLLTASTGSPPLDVLVRTSGVQRLSDFMLWQCCENTQLQFSSTFWPNFDLMDFVPVILEYQRKVWNNKVLP